jgi:prepilin-type N-terminal cleavage/methylation domain-containing protein
MLRNQTSQTRGFTLVEILVVIAIIAILLGIILPALSGIIFKSQEQVCKVDISQIEIALKSYSSDFRDFPPSTVKELGLKDENNLNSGNEALVLCLSSGLKTDTYYEFKEDRLENTDLDSSPVPLKKLTGSVFQTQDLLEITDPWGNPYVYFHSRNLNTATTHNYQINGQLQAAKPYAGKSKTGNFPGYGKYQVISLGGDMTVGTEDDIRSN